MGKYDDAYKFLFSNKKIFLQLLQSFVDEDFIKDIHLDDIDLLDKSFVSDEFLQRESDIIYRIKLKANEIYIYILVEFQSTVDKSIPVRMLLYLLQFYDLLLRNSRKGNLPAVFPVLLYNGSQDWTIPSNIKDLIDKTIPEKYIPSFEYYKIIEKNIPDEKLEKLQNLVSAIIYLEKKRDEQGIGEAINKVVEMIKEENIKELRMFTIWFKRMFHQRVNPEDTDKISNLMEVKSMLTEVADKLIEKGKIEGKIEGKCELAKKMKELDYSISEISKITGLSSEEIEKL